MENRRNALKKLTAAALAIGTGQYALGAAKPETEDGPFLKGRIRHSVCRWTCDYLPLDKLCLAIKEIGFAAIDLAGPKDWPVLRDNAIECSMCNGAEISLTKGWNDKQHHAQLIKNYTEHIELVAQAGYKNLICFSGNRNGMDDETGLKNCVEGLKQIMSLAEKKNVMIQLELFNSKVDHKDYMADNSPWGIELCKRIGSPNFKLLYDIYHMQVNEGNIIQTIRNNHIYFGHYHTAGVPGRHEIDDSQELFYPAVMRAIADTGFKGFVAQEFITTGKDTKGKLASLKKAVQLCDI